MNWLRDPDTEPIPGYRLVEPLGSGGFGEVWKCVAPGGIPKAIKFVAGADGTLGGDDPRAEQELKALARVKEVRHPFVLSTEQVREVAGELVVVMELADRSLHDCLEEHQAAGRPGIPRERLLGYLADAAAGLDHLNEVHNLQHLDVKPRNLFVVGDRVKVADFGLVKHLDRLSGAGLLGGATPAYAAPETLAGKVGRRTDQYSLAIVYVELLTGRRPFAGANVRQLALQHTSAPPDLSGLPPADRPVVARALAKDPDARHPSCAAFVRALQECGTDGRDRLTTLPSFSIPQADVHTPHPSDEDLLTPTVLTAAGGLRPAVLVGVGSYGRRALQEVRSRLADRVGDLGQVPALRFLYLDTDPDAAAKAAAARPAGALAPDEVVPIPLRQAAEYRRRPGGAPDWLPREKLHAIPRSLRAGENRALGRLAFVDHAPRVLARLRRELRAAGHADSLARSAERTGLPVGGGPPRVYVFAAGTGGSGGMLADLGQGARRVLARLGCPAAPVVLFLSAAAPNDPRTADWELANLYAAVTELNHAADPEARLPAPPPDPDGSTPGAAGPPFTAMYLMPLGERTTGGFRDGLAKLAAYLAHDLLTPLGLSLDALRALPPAPGRTPFRGFGTFGVWFPRGLLLQAAAQVLTGRLLRRWVDPDEPGDRAAREAADRLRADPRFAPAEVRKLIDRETPRAPEGGAAAQVERWLRGLEGQWDNPSRRPDLGPWAEAAGEQARELVGARPTNPADSAVRRGKLAKALDVGIARAAEAWGNEFAAAARPLGDAPGRRLAAVEAGLRALGGVCDAAAAKADEACRAFAARCRQARADVQAALEACRAGGGALGFIGDGPGRAARHLLDTLREFTRLRLDEDRLDATARFYRAARRQADDRLGDIAAARARLAPLIGLGGPQSAEPGADTLADEAVEATPPPGGTARMVLPGGEGRPDRAVDRLLAAVRPDDLQRLDAQLQKVVLGPAGGLLGLCGGGTDLDRTVLGPMAEHAATFLADLLPAADVTEVELSAARAAGADPLDRVREYHRRAAPTDGPAADERAFAVVPDSDAGREFAGLVRRALPAAEVVPVPGAGTDLLFCREQGYWPADDLRAVLVACRPAYEVAAEDPATNPHSRFDVADWLPAGE